jgi:hypothetical protein
MQVIVKGLIMLDKRMVGILAILLLVGFAGSSSMAANAPVCELGVKLMPDLTNGLGGASWCVADWNSDGKRDLVGAGQTVANSDGRVYVYLNQGTDAAPVFTDYTVIESGGEPIQLYLGG